ncbi:hypothetical protein G872_00284 [Escherichia coli HVH 221 (4-3136817)]|nr:hypothetical protein G872_00284 [Escherichia coli HVH 221 (4-3136817)]
MVRLTRRLEVLEEQRQRQQPKIDFPLYTIIDKPSIQTPRKHSFSNPPAYLLVNS